MALDTGNALVTLAETKSYLGATSSTSNDGRITRLINSVSNRFNLETKRKLKSRSLTEFYDGNGGNTLWTNEFPIVSVSTNIAITVDSDRA
jgi:hypothetical protein